MRRSLEALVDRLDWAAGTDQVLAVMPRLADELPPLEWLDQAPAILLPTPLPLLTGLLSAMCDALESVGTPDPLVDSAPAEAGKDPLVASLLALWLQCGRPGCRSQAVPALALAWAASGLVAGQAGWIRRIPAPLAERWTAASRVLEQAGSEAHIRMLSERLGARLGAAQGLAIAAGVGLSGQTITRAIMTNPLMIACPAQSMEPLEDLARVGALLQTELDPALMGALFPVAQVAWRGVSDRVRTRSASSLDSVLSQLIGPGGAPAALMDPIVGPALIRALPELVQPADLRSAGLEPRVAKAMLSERALRPLSAAWVDLVTPLRTWGVLSTVVSWVTPIWSTGSGVEVKDREHPPSARWSLRLPRIGTRPHAVVAVRLSGLIEAAEVECAREGMATIWRTLVEAEADAVGMMVHDTGIAVFTCPERAAHFAHSAHQKLPGNLGIMTHPISGEELAVPPDMRVGIGLAWGEVDGGTDGAGVWFEGRAVAAAVALMGQARPSLRTQDPLGIRAAVGQPDGLRSDGIVAESSFIEALKERLEPALHRRGSTDMVGGVGEDFRFYPVPYWWEAAAEVWMWVQLESRGEAGAAELIVFSRVMFRDIHSRDRDLERSDIREPPSEIDQAPPSVGVAPADKPGWSPFDAIGRGGVVANADPWAQLDGEPEVEFDDE